ncbi:MAG: PD-(D/E)XK nuclease-like domain-containing protein [Sandaracinaceae bacterium]
MSAAAENLDAYAQIEALNWSSLKHLATSAKLLHYRSEAPRPDTKALRVGRAVHCAVFEPARWRSEYVAQPDFGDLRTKKAKAAREEWREQLVEGVEVISADEHALAMRLAKAVREHPDAAKILRSGRAEEVVTWTDPETGVECKGRFDWITPRFICDLKSTRQSNLRGMRADFARFLYHGQLAWYHDGAIAAKLIPADAEQPRAIVVQTVEPFDVVPFFLLTSDLERGRALYRSLLHRYVECQSAEWWPGLAPSLTPLDLPPWAAGGDDETDEEDW